MEKEDKEKSTSKKSCFYSEHLFKTATKDPEPSKEAMQQAIFQHARELYILSIVNTAAEEEREGKRHILPNLLAYIAQEYANFSMHFSESEEELEQRLQSRAETGSRKR